MSAALFSLQNKTILLTGDTRAVAEAVGKELGISEDEVIKHVMLGETVDGQFTAVEDIGAMIRFLCEFPSTALTGQSFIVSHGWHMQ